MRRWETSSVCSKLINSVKISPPEEVDYYFFYLLMIMRHRSSSHAMFRKPDQWNVSVCQAFSRKYYPEQSGGVEIFLENPEGLSLIDERNMELHLLAVT